LSSVNKNDRFACAAESIITHFLNFIGKTLYFSRKPVSCKLDFKIFVKGCAFQGSKHLSAINSVAAVTRIFSKKNEITIA
jgi:hypothetical protein